MYLKILNGKMIIAANVRRLFTELCTALPISINASTGIPKAFPYAGSNTNALIKHATTAVSTVPTAHSDHCMFSALNRFIAVDQTCPELQMYIQR